MIEQVSNANCDGLCAFCPCDCPVLTGPGVLSLLASVLVVPSTYWRFHLRGSDESVWWWQRSVRFKILSHPHPDPGVSVGSRLHSFGESTMVIIFTGYQRCVTRVSGSDALLCHQPVDSAADTGYTTGTKQTCSLTSLQPTKDRIAAVAVQYLRPLL